LAQESVANPLLQSNTPTPGNPVIQVAAEETLTEKTKKNTDRVMNFVTGREQENPTRAKDLYKKADALFRRGEKLPRNQAQSLFKNAADLFRSAGEAAPGTALQQDALFMQGESLFFADRLVEASDVYETLQKDFPRNRHIDRVAARLFSISRYWVDVAKKQEGSWFTLNLFDAKRPRIDTDGHAIRVLDQIRYDDPTGRLADDATMAAAAEFIRQKKFEKADEFLTDLRETFADSEHLFLAHLLGIRCKMETYAGPRYSGLVLDEAETLVRQTRQRFPDKLKEEKYGEMIARAAAEIDFHRAARYAYRAEYREKKGEFGAARYYYNELLKSHGDTPQAKVARQRLQQIAKLPSVPEQRLSWLTTIFPDSRASDPLEMTPSSNQPSDAKPKTMLR
jgi:tetratricopeptide (TPR) repeat protein